MNDTIFGKIIRKEIPATVVYEDEQFLAFMDINPLAKGHTLLIPKEQYAWMQDAPDEVVSAVFLKAKELILVLKKTLECDYVQLMVVGNEVPHFHIHLIPRMHGEDIHGPHVKYEEGEMQSIAQKIIAGFE
ncbi:MAG TPA: HIT family protein [Candidatus Paceibacterota bacterium]|nr:HIT family protein [Candidatus Paceibacterota bacterium]